MGKRRATHDVEEADDRCLGGVVDGEFAEDLDLPQDTFEAAESSVVPGDHFDGDQFAGLTMTSDVNFPFGSLPYLGLDCVIPQHVL